MEIIHIKKVLFGLWSTLLLGISGIIILDERFFHPIQGATRSVELSSLYKGQPYDAIPMQRSADIYKNSLSLHAESMLAKIMPRVFSIMHNKPSTFDSRGLFFIDRTDADAQADQGYGERQFRSEYAYDFVQRCTAMMWGMRVRIELRDAVHGSTNKFQEEEQLSHKELELEYVAQRGKNQLAVSKRRIIGGYVRSNNQSKTKKIQKRTVSDKKGQVKQAQKQSQKRLKRRKGAVQAALGAFATHSRLRGKNRGVTGPLPALVHLKPIAPGSTIKPQSAHDAWQKKRQHPIFSWPLDPKDFWVSSLFGPRRKPNGAWALHAGVDLAACRGTPVRAAREGRVIKAAYSSGYGNFILIEHSKKYQTRYAHLDKILVRVGQTVCAGDYIGRVGSTGFVRKSRWGSSGSHLHFEVYVYGKAKNPFCFLA